MDDSNQKGGGASYIRTYASDAAALGGTIPVARSGRASPVNVPAPVAAPAAIAPDAPTTKEKRDDVLARLRARGVSGVPGSMPLPEVAALPTSTLIPPMTTPADVASAPITPTPAFAPKPPPIISVPEPVPTSIPQVSKSATAPIHTYASDFRDEAKTTRASTFTVLAAQQDAGNSAGMVLPPKKPPRLIYIGGALLVLLGIGSIYAAYRFATGHANVPATLAVPSLVFADARAKISGSGGDLQKTLVALENTKLADGGVLVAYASVSSTTAAGPVELLQPGTVLINALKLNAPDLLLRNITGASTLGLVRASGETRPFFVLRVSSYERTFAAMLSWEPTMSNDLSALFPPFPVAVVGTTTVTSTATTTPAKSGKTKVIAPVVPPAPIYPPPAFFDEVVANHDTRVYRDGLGRTVFLYGYRDQSTLIIARDEAAFTDLLARMNANATGQ